MKEYKKKEKQKHAFEAMSGVKKQSTYKKETKSSSGKDNNQGNNKKSSYRGEDNKKSSYRGEDNKKSSYRGEDNKKSSYRGEDNKKSSYRRNENQDKKPSYQKRNQREQVEVKEHTQKEYTQKEYTKKKITQGCLVCQECGQCNGQQVTYTEHVASKQARLAEALMSYGKPLPMVKMDKARNYKTRVHREFHHERNGAPMSGYFSTEEGRLVKIEECYIDDKKCQEIIHTIKGLLKSFKIKTYDMKSGHGLLRYVAVRRGLESQEIMVTLVLSSIIMPSKNNFVKELRRLHPEITTILISENYKAVENIYGDKEVNLYGKGFIWDSMCGKEFRISAKSQFAVNPIQMKKMCDTISEWGEFQGNELLLDAYCGVGTFGITLSDKVRKILSVETNQEMHRDAISNIKKNGIKNIDVYKNSPAEFVMQVAKSEKEDIGVAIVSQPYNGCGKEFIDSISKARPKKIFLVSRNMKSLRSEIEMLANAGYRVKKAVGVDIHPWTERVDAVVLLIRR